jgi:hypothetical protein
MPVWRDSDLPALAADFASKHGLQPKMARRLERMLAEQRAAVLASLAATAASLGTTGTAVTSTMGAGSIAAVRS